MTKHAGPPCGNNPNHSLTDGDRQAVDGFRAYLAARAALRNRIAEALEQADYRPDMRRGDLADAVMAVLPNAGATAALAEDLRYLLNYRGPGHDHERPGVWDTSGMPCGHCARREAARRNLAAYDASSDAALPPPADDEGDELVCVDQCGSCDACGMEPFGTPAEGWRQAAHFLRRAARASGDRAGALHGARLIEAELRRLADEAQPQPDTEAWDVPDARPGTTDYTLTRPAADARPEPSVHGESVAHLAGLHDDEPAVDARQGGAQS
ncbi:hypothetical protein [Streptomyces nigra]|uniref:hypothetical protein n=1 Tax=Streptomyces nigra TaxID=1827580 RepID=UPI0036308D96